MITKSERRFIRRELINKALHAKTIGEALTLRTLILTVREWERLNYRVTRN